MHRDSHLDALLRLVPSAGVALIWSTTSMPAVTSPKPVYWPAAPAAGWRQTKNCVPALSRLEGLRTAADRAAEEGAVRQLGLQQAEATVPVLRGLVGVLRERIAALDDPARDHAVDVVPS